MARFKYTAVGADGVAVSDTVEAVSASGLENELLRRGLRQIKVREKKSLTQIEVTKERVPPTEIMHFSRQLAAFVRTGIPITDAIRIVQDGVSSKRFKAVLGDIEEALHGGVPLSQAVAMHREVFPPYYVGILRSAELTGRLDLVLEQLSSYIERDLEARARIKSALAYPLVVFALAIVTIGVLTVFVLPRFVDFFDDLDSELPLPTRILLGISGFLSSPPGLALVGVIVLAGIAFAVWGRTPTGRAFRHRMVFKIPVVGQIARFAAVERFSRVISAMMGAGVPLPDAMGAAIDSVNNAVFEDALRGARDEMIQGGGIAGPLAATGVFPLPAVQMVKVGEETGTLESQIDAAANFYSKELQYKLQRLTTLFEPAVIIFMGVVVGFVAVALISAMYGVLQGVESDI